MSKRKSAGEEFDGVIADFGVARAIKWGVTLIAVVVLLGIVGNLLGLVGTVVGTGTGVITRTLNADNVIATYEAFKDRAEAFNARKAQIVSYNRVVAASKDNTALIEQEAMRQSCRQIAAEYNAESAKVNKSIFKGQDAPERLDASECDA